MNPQQDGPPSPIKIDVVPGASAVIIAFGSLRLNMKIPPFEWGGVLSELPVSRIYLRELNRRWYLRGLPRLADSAQGLADYLQAIISDNGWSRVIMVGGSMGGYGAILFGHLLSADDVYAFAPQTFLPPRKGRILANTIIARRWQLLQNQWKLQLDRHVDRRFFDLRPLIQKNPAHTRYHLYFSVENEKDLQHAEHLRGIANVELHGRGQLGHHVGVAMRNSGELNSLLHLAATA